MSRARPWLYVVTTAAPPVLYLDALIGELHDDGWNVAVIATPTAASWIDLDDLAASTGCPTRVHPRPPREQDSLPRAQAVLAAPLTANSLNKWSAGHSDTLALGILNEMAGTTVPILAVPCVKAVLRQHLAYGESITRLSTMGVSFMDPDTVTTKSEDGLATLTWAQITAALADLYARSK